MADFSFIADPISRSYTQSGYEQGKRDGAREVYERMHSTLQSAHASLMDMTTAQNILQADLDQIRDKLQYISDHATPATKAEIGMLLMEFNKQRMN